MTEYETFDLQAFNDFREARRRGFQVSESRPTRGPSFGAYVVRPALLFGILTALVTLGMVATLAVFLVWLMPHAVDHYWIIAIGCSVAAGAVVMGYTAIFLMDDWRELQVRRVERTYLGEPKRDIQRGRVFVQTSPTQYKGGSLDWELDIEEQLARRVYDERARWIGSDKVTRRILSADKDKGWKNLYPNPTENYEAARADLRHWGWIDGDDRWTEKARTVLLNKLRIL